MCACFSGKSRQLLHILIIHIMRISYIKLDHMLYSSNYCNSIKFYVCRLHLCGKGNWVTAQIVTTWLTITAQLNFTTATQPTSCHCTINKWIMSLTQGLYLAHLTLLIFCHWDTSTKRFRQTAQPRKPSESKSLSVGDCYFLAHPSTVIRMHDRKGCSQETLWKHSKHPTKNTHHNGWPLAD